MMRPSRQGRFLSVSEVAVDPTKAEAGRFESGYPARERLRTRRPPRDLGNAGLRIFGQLMTFAAVVICKENEAPRIHAFQEHNAGGRAALLISMPCNSKICRRWNLCSEVSTKWAAPFAFNVARTCPNVSDESGNSSRFR